MNVGLVALGLLFLGGNILAFGLESTQGVVTTALSASLSETATTISVDSTSGFPGSGSIIIEDETISYSGTTSTSFTGATRGANDTDAATHDNGTQVYSETAGLLNQALNFKIIESDAGTFDKVLNVGHDLNLLVKYVGRIVIADFAFFDFDVLGVPLTYFQYMLIAINIGFLLSVGVQIRNLVLG